MSYRLLKVVCQAVLVATDDDGNLVEHIARPVQVPAADWPGYPERLAGEIAALENGKAARVVPVD
jgi:hypothetical protein